MRPTYKLLSLLLQYPSDEILAARPAIDAAVSALPPGRDKKAIERFWSEWRTVSGTDAQSRYVDTFDLQKRSSLYLTYYEHGDTRKRGAELVRLKRAYRHNGVVLESGELPDFLPVMLEFAAIAEPGAGETVLAEHRAALELLRHQLETVASPYRHLVEAICLRLPRLSRTELRNLRDRLGRPAPYEEVGLEPFAPPEVMPAQGPMR